MNDSPQLRRVALSASLAIAMVVLSGCGGGKDRATVTGKVTYNNNPVPGGNIMLLPAGGGGASTSLFIQPDGTFSSADVVPGEYTVTVETESVKNAVTGKPNMGAMSGAAKSKMETMMKGAAQPQVDVESKSNYVKIPAKYATAQTSPIKWTVKKGKQTLDIALTD